MLSRFAASKPFNVRVALLLMCLLGVSAVVGVIGTFAAINNQADHSGMLLIFGVVMGGFGAFLLFVGGAYNRFGQVALAVVAAIAFVGSFIFVTSGLSLFVLRHPTFFGAWGFAGLFMAIGTALYARDARAAANKEQKRPANLQRADYIRNKNAARPLCKRVSIIMALTGIALVGIGIFV